MSKNIKKRDKPMKIMRYIAVIAFMVFGCMLDSGTWIPLIVTAVSVGFLLIDAWLRFNR